MAERLRLLVERGVADGEAGGVEAGLMPEERVAVGVAVTAEGVAETVGDTVGELEGLAPVERVAVGVDSGVGDELGVA